MLKRIAAVMSAVLILLSIVSPSVSAADVIKITQQPSADTGYVGDKLSFTVKASDSAGKKLDYQWFFGSKKSDGTVISDTELTNTSSGFEGTDTATLTLALTVDMLATDRVFYVYCIISDSDGNVAKTDEARVVAIEDVDYEIPVNYRPGGEIKAVIGDEVMITVGTTISEAQIGVLSYQWFTFGENGIKSAIPVDGENKPYLTVQTKNSGINYYYCIITNDKNGKIIHSSTPEDNSQAVMVTVVEAEGTDKLLPFRDVSSGDAFYSDLRIAYESGVINGKTNDLFYPDEKLTTAETVKLASCLHALAVGRSYTFEQGESWYTVYYDYAIANLLISEELPSEPDYAITRVQFAEIFTNLLKDGINAENVVTQPSLSGENMPLFESEAVSAMISSGVMELYPDGEFHPDDYIDRSNAAVMTARMIELLNISL